jgi:hypothetical protein
MTQPVEELRQLPVGMRGAGTCGRGRLRGGDRKQRQRGGHDTGHGDGSDSHCSLRWIEVGWAGVPRGWTGGDSTTTAAEATAAPHDRRLRCGESRFGQM